MLRLFRVTLVVLYLWTGLSKLLDVPAFAASLRNYHLVPEALIPLLAYSIPILEIALALLLVLRPMSPGVPLASLVFSSQLLIVNCSAIVRGLDVSCGCFGASSKSIDFKILLLDLMMMAMSYRLLSASQAQDSDSKSGATSKPWLSGIFLLLIAITTLSIAWKGKSEVAEATENLPINSHSPRKRRPPAISVSPTPPVLKTIAPEEPDTKTLSTVEFIPPVVELDELAQGEITQTTVQIINHGQEPVTITGIETGCHCTEVHLETSTLLPNVLVPMVVKYQATSGTGRIGQSISLEFEENDETPSLVVIASIKSI